MKRKDNIIVKETMYIMSMILKERLGITQKEIARELGVNESTFSRWIKKEGSSIPEIMRQRFFEYLNREEFSDFGNELREAISENLKLQTYGKIKTHMNELNYSGLLAYLFKQLTVEALEKENEQKLKYFKAMKVTLRRKLFGMEVCGKTFEVQHDIFDEEMKVHENECIETGINNDSVNIVQVKRNREVCTKYMIIYMDADPMGMNITAEDKRNFIMENRYWDDVDDIWLINFPSFYAENGFNVCGYSSFVIDEDYRLFTRGMSGLEQEVIDIEQYNKAKVLKNTDFIVRRIINLLIVSESY